MSTAPSTAPAPLQAVMLTVDQIVINPRNVRRDLDLDDAFVQSIAANGVKVPVVVVPLADASGAGTGQTPQYELKMGHRRHGGAKKAKRTEIPAVILDPSLREAGEDYIDQLIENATEYRRGLSELEQADALFGALDAGMKVTAVAKRTGRTRDQVTRAAKASRSLGEQTRKSLTEIGASGANEPDMETLAVLGEFDDDPDAVTRLLKAISRGGFSFTYQAERERAEREERQARAAVREELTTAGIQLWEDESNLPPRAARLSTLTDADGAALEEQAHRTCPGHAVMWDADHDTPGAVAALCTDPATHGHAPVQQPDAEQDQEQDQADSGGVPHAEKVQGNKDYRAATRARRTWLTTLIARKSAPKALPAWTASQFLICPTPMGKWQGSGAHVDILAELMGRDPESDRATWIAGSATAARLSLSSFALVAACYEKYIDPAHTWRHDNPQWDTAERREAARSYLTFLVSVGYEASPIEQALIDGEPYQALPGDA
ncbi:ParB N-terminal domain-containing protein [Streptomyces sp. NPDC046925]|uniref:ParB/RepB/Spo0J family partition protein n=1 Tax=Streptomyces sp. NPDC046925 TaxID=3155375 RepID=UPI0033C8FBE9